MTRKFTLKVSQADTTHTTKFYMAVGEIYLRKTGDAAGYSLGHKENYESREDAIETIKGLIRKFFGSNGFDVEFNKVEAEVTA